MITQRVAFFEFPVFQGVFPLVSGYLEATARQHPGVEDRYEYQKYSIPISTPGIAEKVEAVDADIFAFSCYVWNMGLIKRILSSLLARTLPPKIILGGPQVMNRPDRYLSPKHENIILCNGEGERTFAGLLAQFASATPDLSKVRGISFYRDGELFTTAKEERIQSLDEIPSPYLTGCLNPKGYAWAVIETNRGCPFTCTYCYWGAATNAKVNAFSLERIFNELTWLSENRVLYVFIADANFGMLKRDVEIAEHLAKCREKYGCPVTVYFSSSKNTPERVVEITRTFQAAGLVATHPISLQSVNPETLKRVRRSNIKTSSYIELQKVLNETKLSSFLEIIWPLPGETLESFKEGLCELCRMGADTFVVYPLLLINNVEMAGQREQHGLVTIMDPDPNSEAEIVVGTKEVSNADYREGIKFAYHMMSLYSLRGLRHVGTYLDAASVLSFSELVARFSVFCDRLPQNRYSTFIRKTIASSEHYRFTASGGIVHVTLHAAREEFDGLLCQFMRTLSCWNDPEVRFLFELDLLNRPHIYFNTPISRYRGEFEIIQIDQAEPDGYLVAVPAAHWERARVALCLPVDACHSRLRINYRTTQFPFMPGKSLDDNYSYCQDKLHKMGSILPVWTVLEPEVNSTVLQPAGDLPEKRIQPSDSV